LRNDPAANWQGIKLCALSVTTLLDLSIY